MIEKNKNLSSPVKKVEVNTEQLQEEEQPWLLSYSDMFTLLFCFFVVLISMAFRFLDWVKIEQMLKVFSPHEEMSLPELYEKVQQLIRQYNLEENVNVQLTAKGVEISFKEKATFDKGEAKLKKEIFPILTVIAKLLNEKGIDRRKIIVEGHTDSLPISTKEFPSNWELSSARAGTVVRFLSECGLNPKRFEAVGYADTRPKVEYTHPKEGQPENRRVVVVVSPEPYSLEYLREEVSVEEAKKKFSTGYLSSKTTLEQQKEKPITEKEISKQIVSTSEPVTGPEVRNIVQQQVIEQKFVHQQEDEKLQKRKQLMQQYFSLGQQKFKEGNYNAAIIYFKKVLEIDPNHTSSKINIERAKKMLQKK